MDPNEFYADALMNMDPVLKDMGLRPRYLRILLMWKPALTADELAAMTKAELGKIPGIGEKGVRDIRRAFEPTLFPGGRAAKIAPLPDGMVVKVRIDPKLAHRVEEFLSARGLTLDQAVGLYLRAMINTSASARALRLKDAMPYGKYRGEIIETIVRVQPDYIAYLVSNSTQTRWDPEVLRLLEEVTK